MQDNGQLRLEKFEPVNGGLADVFVLDIQTVPSSAQAAQPCNPYQNAIIVYKPYPAPLHMRLQAHLLLMRRACARGARDALLRASVVTAQARVWQHATAIWAQGRLQEAAMHAKGLAQWIMLAMHSVAPVKHGAVHHISSPADGEGAAAPAASAGQQPSVPRPTGTAPGSARGGLAESLGTANASFWHGKCMLAHSLQAHIAWAQPPLRMETLPSLSQELADQQVHDSQVQNAESQRSEQSARTCEALEVLAWTAMHTALQVYMPPAAQLKRTRWSWPGLATVLGCITVALVLALVVARWHHRRQLAHAAAQYAEHVAAMWAQHALQLGQLMEQHNAQQASQAEVHAVALSELQQAHAKRLARTEMQHMQQMQQMHALSAAAVHGMRQNQAMLSQLATAAKANSKRGLSALQVMRTQLAHVQQQLGREQQTTRVLAVQLEAVRMSAACDSRKQAERVMQSLGELQASHAAEVQALCEQHSRCLAQLHEEHRGQLAGVRGAAARRERVVRAGQARMAKAWLALREHHKLLLEHLEARCTLQAQEHNLALQRLEAALQGAHAQARELQEEVGRLRGDVEERDAVIGDLHEHLDERMNEVMGFQGQLRAKDQQVAHHLRLLDELQGTLQSVEEKVHDHEERARGLERQLAQSQDMGGVWRSEAEALRGRLEDAEVQLAQLPGLHAKLGDAAAALREFVARQSAGEEQLEVLEGEVVARDELVADLQGQLEDAVSAGAAREAELTALLDNKEREMRRKEEAKEREVRMRLNDIALLQQENSALQEEVRALRKHREPLPSAGNVLAALSTNTHASLRLR